MAKVINKSTSTFSHFMDSFKEVAKDEFNFQLGYDYNEKEIYQLYEQGMDVYEAIENYKEQLEY